MITANDRTSTLGLGMLALLGACHAARPAQPTVAPHPLQPLIVPQRDLMQRKPDLRSPSVTIWNVQQTDSIRINLVEMRGELRRHVHPDAAHSLLLLEGSVKATIGDAVVVMNKGDFVSIPAGVSHGYTTVTPSALLISADAPYYDPRKTIYERAPGP